MVQAPGHTSKENIKKYFLATSSQQIPGKNSECKIKLP